MPLFVSFRTLRNILGHVYIFQRLCDKFQIQEGRICIGCDNIGAFDKGLGTQFFPSIQHKHFGIIWALHSVRNELPIEVAFVHVPSHQDDRKNFDTLDQFAQLNVYWRMKKRNGNCRGTSNINTVI